MHVSKNAKTKSSHSFPARTERESHNRGQRPRHCELCSRVMSAPIDSMAFDVTEHQAQRPFRHRDDADLESRVPERLREHGHAGGRQQRVARRRGELIQLEDSGGDIVSALAVRLNPVQFAFRANVRK